jgi:MFS transporter, DHA2 family, multidrug resistance protein
VDTRPEFSCNRQAGGYPDNLDGRLLKVAGVCVLASAMPLLDTTAVTVAQQPFIAEFCSTQAVVGWTMTGYALSFAMVIPLTGWAVDRFGAKRLFLGSLVLFSLGSLLCALAPSIGLLVAFRMVQGLGAGMLVPLPAMILTREAGPHRLGRLTSVTDVPLMLGAIAGPILGGWLIDSFGWQCIFLINLPIGLLALALAGVVFSKDQPSSGEPFDVIGALLLSPGLVIFLFGVSSIPSYGTMAAPRVCLTVAIGLLLIVAFVFHALYRAHRPLIDLRLFKNRVVTLANVTVFLFLIALFGAELLFPSYFQQLLNQTHAQSGVHLIPLGLGAAASMPIGGRYLDKNGPGKVVLVGIALTAASMGVFAYGVSQHFAYLPVLLIALAAMGMGVGCTLTPVSASAMRVLRPSEVARGSILLNVNRQVAGAIGTALMSVILTGEVNRSANTVGTGHAVIQLDTTAGRGQPPNLSVQKLPADAMEHAIHDLSHSYAVVFAVAVSLVVIAIIPASFLPKKPAQPPSSARSAR